MKKILMLAVLAIMAVSASYGQIVVEDSPKPTYEELASVRYGFASFANYKGYKVVLKSTDKSDLYIYISVGNTAEEAAASLSTLAKLFDSVGEGGSRKITDNAGTEYLISILGGRMLVKEVGIKYKGYHLLERGDCDAFLKAITQ